MTSAVDIRQVREGDWVAFREVRLRALREDPTAFGARYEDQLRRDDIWWRDWAAKSEAGGTHALFLAYDGDQPVGMAGGVVEDEAVWLISMWVAPEARRRGIGRALGEAVVSWAKAGRHPTLGLHVETANEAAINLYRHLGFEPTGEVTPLPSNPELRVATLELRLPN